MKQRILTGLAIIAVVLPTFLIGGIPFKVLVFLFISVGLYEVYALKKDSWPIWIYFLILIMLLFMVNLSIENLYVALTLSMLILMSLPIIFEWFLPFDAGYLISMILLFSAALKSVLLMMTLGNLVLVYMLVVTYITDTAAYFSGYLFGKHKLNERISPKKTVEGAIGGWLVSFAISTAYSYFFITTVPFIFMLIASLILPIVSQFGDLALSAIKRYFGVKDFGTIFPAHGGVLDRIDSLLFVLVGFYILYTFVLI